MRLLLAALFAGLLLPTAHADDPIPAPGGGRLHGPDVVFQAPGTKRIRDVTLTASDDGNNVDLYALVAVKGKEATVHHRRSTDGGRSWGDPGNGGIKLDNRAEWVRAYRAGGKAWLVVGNNPLHPPQTPRVTHFQGKKYAGFPGWLSIASMGADGRTCETNSGRLRLENVGKVVFSHHGWNVSFRMFAKDKTLTLVGSAFFIFKKKRVWGLVAARSADGGKTWKTNVMKQAMQGLNVLKPAMILRKGTAIVDVFTGNSQTKKIVQFSFGEDWKKENEDVQGVGKVNFWHDGVSDPDGTMVITDTCFIRKPDKEKGIAATYGIAEFAKTDKGWVRRCRIDSNLDKPYSALSSVRGKQRAHRFYGTGTTVYSEDGGKSWIKAPFSGTVKSGQSAFIPNRGLALLRGNVSTTPAGEKRYVVKMMVLTTK